MRLAIITQQRQIRNVTGFFFLFTVHFYFPISKRIRDKEPPPSPRPVFTDIIHRTNQFPSRVLSIRSDRSDDTSLIILENTAVLSSNLSTGNAVHRSSFVYNTDDVRRQYISEWKNKTRKKKAHT